MTRERRLQHIFEELKYIDKYSKLLQEVYNNAQNRNHPDHKSPKQLVEDNKIIFNEFRVHANNICFEIALMYHED